MPICGKRYTTRFRASAGPNAGRMVSFPVRCNQPKGHSWTHIYSAAPRRKKVRRSPVPCPVDGCFDGYGGTIFNAWDQADVDAHVPVCNAARLARQSKDKVTP